MHGPSAPLDELAQGVLSRATTAACCRARASSISPIGKGVAPGVFVVAEMRHPRLRERMNDLKLGEGPYYTFYRPYHLTSLEVPLSGARAVLYGQSRHAAAAGARRRKSARVAKTRSAARRDARCDRRILLSRLRAVARRCASRKRVPLGLAQGAKVTRTIAKGELPDLRQLRARRAPADRRSAPRARTTGCGWPRQPDGDDAMHARLVREPRADRRPPPSVPSSRRSTRRRCARR